MLTYLQSVLSELELAREEYREWARGGMEATVSTYEGMLIPRLDALIQTTEILIDAHKLWIGEEDKQL